MLTQSWDGDLSIVDFIIDLFAKGRILFAELVTCLANCINICASYLGSVISEGPTNYSHISSSLELDFHESDIKPRL